MSVSSLACPIHCETRQVKTLLCAKIFNVKNKLPRARVPVRRHLYGNDKHISLCKFLLSVVQYTAKRHKSRHYEAPKFSMWKISCLGRASPCDATYLEMTSTPHCVSFLSRLLSTPRNDTSEDIMRRQSLQCEKISCLGRAFPCDATYLEMTSTSHCVSFLPRLLNTPRNDTSQDIMRRQKFQCEK